MGAMPNVEAITESWAKDIIVQRSALNDRLRLYERSSDFLKAVNDVINELPEDEHTYGMYVWVGGVEPVTLNFMLYNKDGEPRASELPRRLAKSFGVNFTKSMSNSGQMLQSDKPVNGWHFAIHSYLTPGCKLRKVTEKVEVTKFEVDCGAEVADV